MYLPPILPSLQILEKKRPNKIQQNLSSIFQQLKNESDKKLHVGLSSNQSIKSEHSVMEGGPWNSDANKYQGAIKMEINDSDDRFCLNPSRLLCFSGI